MKKNIIFGIFCLFMMSLTSCSDLLDTKPYDKITGDQTWTSQDLTAGYVYQIYNDVLGVNTWLSSYGSSYSCRSESSTKNAMTGTLNSSYWAKDRAEMMTKNDNYEWINYGILWRIHLAFDEVAKSSSFSDEFKKRVFAELHFLRAAHYFVFAKQYGGLQIIDRVLTLEDNLQIPRSTAAETYDFILEDLKLAAGDLPETTERGRASKAAAHSLIMRVALQAASYVDGGSSDSKYYDLVISSGKALDLNEAGSQLSPYFDMFRAYASAVAASEQILTRERSKTNSSLSDTPMQYQGLWSSGQFSDYAKVHFPIDVTMNFWGMDGGAWPTQDLVDDYLVRDVDGSIKKWSEATYVQTGTTVDEKMYFSDTKKRDLRFYTTILYDGCSYFNDEVKVYFRRDGNVSNANSKINEGSEAEFGYRAGNTENFNSSTGYGMVKYHYDHIVSLPSPGDQKMDFCYSILRYGEAYLNMAEAYLMKGDYANARAFMSATMVKHGGFEKSKVDEYLSSLTGNNWGDSLFEAYKRERNVEMVFENNDRYWTLLRLGMRKSGGLQDGQYANNGFLIPEMQGSLRGIRISRDGKDYSFFEDNNNVGEAKFTSKRYLLPINEDFRIKAGLTQNPGWE